MIEEQSTNDLHQKVHELILHNNTDETILKFKQIEDKELSKKYDAYFIETSSNKYVLKKSEYEANIYEMLLNDEDIAVPKYYGKTKILDNSTWFLLEYIDGKVFINEDLENYCNAAYELAVLHSKFMGLSINKKEYSFVNDSDEKISVKLNKIIEKHMKYELNWSKGTLRILEYAIKRLNKRPRTLIENDLLPINIMISDKQIKIIDWGNAAVGIYTQDIGRLLSDFKDEKGTYWVNNKWEQDILKVYFEGIKKNSLLELLMDEFMMDFNCSRLLNYAGIVFAHILNNWDASDWYKLNFKGMVNAISKIEKYI